MVVVDKECLAVAGRVRCLCVRPPVILLCHLEQPLPGVELFKRCAGIGRKAVKERLVYEQNLRRLCNGEHRQPPVDLALLQESGDVGAQFLVGKIVAVVHENLRVGHGQNGLGIGDEEVRQLGGARLPVCCPQHRVVNIVGVRHHCDLQLDALLRTDGAVELIDQVIERGIGLSAVDMPDGQRDGFLLPACESAGRQQHEQSCEHGYERRADSDSACFHPSLSSQGNAVSGTPGGQSAAPEMIFLGTLYRSFWKKTTRICPGCLQHVGLARKGRTGAGNPAEVGDDEQNVNRHIDPFDPSLALHLHPRLPGPNPGLFPIIPDFSAKHNREFSPYR